MSNHPDTGRSTTSRTAILDLIVPEKESLEKLAPIFEKFATKKLCRMKDLWRDKARIALDDAVLNALGIEANLDYIRRHLCAEPSIHGGKSTVDFRK